MSTPKLWPQLVDDAKDRDMSRWRLGEIAAVVREADTAWVTQVEALNAELVKYVDISIALERDRDQCALERDAYKAERDALLRVARAAREEAEAEDAYAVLEAEHYPSEPPDDVAGNAWERLTNARVERRTALAALDTKD